MRFLVFCAVACFLALMNSQATSTQDWATKGRYVLEDGNGLYTHCQSAENNLKMGEGDNIQMRSTASQTDFLVAGACWGYIQAVVDSIPQGEGFHPDENVRMSQYVDVVTAYLRNNPSQRQKPAYYLARTALTEAFPGNKAKR
ncbi:MAG: Rap1a/Tai family immunity protein [Candidatus Acidiferrum sp.]